MKTTFNSIRILLLTWSIIVFASLSIRAQENEDGSKPSYRRPEFKVYYSVSEAMQYPDSVYILELRNRKLKDIPAEVFSLPNLLVLDLGKNRISTISSRIGELHNLIELDLSNNGISVLPDEIGSMESLKKLSLNRNVITVLPSTVGKLTNLQELELWDNELNDLPVELKDLHHLKKIELRGILFSDEQQKQFREMLPETDIFMSPSCSCKVN